MNAPAETYSRTRKATMPVLQLSLPPEIHRSIQMAPKAAGVSPENLVVDILRDSFEPVFAGRGEKAATA
jgi:hypothetical protein